MINPFDQPMVLYYPRNFIINNDTICKWLHTILFKRTSLELAPGVNHQDSQLLLQLWVKIWNKAHIWLYVHCHNWSIQVVECLTWPTNFYFMSNFGKIVIPVYFFAIRANQSKIKWLILTIKGQSGDIFDRSFNTIDS